VSDNVGGDSRAARRLRPVRLRKAHSVVHRPLELNAFEFAVLAGLRAAQLARGCTPRVNGPSKVAVIAQLEVAEGKIVRQQDADIVAAVTELI
jgi:DNA-directed RNA polymerase subunit K/omega